MSSQSPLVQILQYRLIPVVVLNDPSDADTLGDALVAGGLPVAEVTFRTEAAPDAIETLAQRGDLIVGAGTVVTPVQVDEAHARGAQFIVSPGFNSAIVERSLELGMVALPGAVTATEIMAAKDLGLDAVKFFPACSGGPKVIKSLAAPFAGMQFVPTGGVNEDNMADYLALPCIPAVGGSWMVPSTLVAAGEIEQLTERVAGAVSAAQAVEKA